MAKGKGTINLRDIPANHALRPARETADGQERSPVRYVPAYAQPHALALPIAPPLPASLAWSAFEHEQTDSGVSWYVVPGGIMAILFGLALVVKNYFFAVFILIAFATLALFRNQQPKKIQFSIGKEGVRADKTLYQASHIKSFWIFARPEHPELSLETSQTLSPYVRIPLGNTDQQQVRDLLLTFVPEQQHPQFLMDEIMRIIGF